ncbi:MAG: outer membrane protein transport protein [Pseudomonadota bacterium]
MKRNHFALTALTTALALAQTSALATNGYFMTGYGFRSQGMGGVGIAYGTDSLSIVANPANIVNTGMRGDMGVGFFNAKRFVRAGSYAQDNPNINNPGFGFDGATTSLRDWFIMPEMGMTMPLTESLHAGIAFVPNGGGSTVYPYNYFSYNAVTPDVPGKGATLGGDLMQLLVPITVGYKINENHSVGAALDVAAQRFRMYGLGSFKTFSSTFGVPISSDYDHLTNNGFDYSYGAGIKVGYLGDFLEDKLSIGLSYTSRTYMTKFDKYKGLFAEQGDFDIPANYGIGVAFKPKKNLVIAVDVSRIQWSSVAALGNRGPGTSPGLAYPGPGQNNALGGIPSLNDSSLATGNDNGMGFGWKDQTIYKLGVNWGVNERLQLRAGYNYGKSPIPDDQLTFNTLFPVTTDKHYSVGFTYKATDELEITGTYMRAPQAVQQSPNDKQNVVGSVDTGMRQQMIALSLGWVLDPGKTNYGDGAMDPISFAGWYFGFGAGQSKGRDWDAARFASSFAERGVVATQTSADSSDTGFKVFGGYQINKYLGFEGGYTQLNDFLAYGVGNTALTGRLYQAQGNNAWVLAAVGTLPLTKNLAVFGKFGADSWKTSTRTIITNTNTADFTRTDSVDRGIDPYYGVGASYALTDNVDVRGEYERYDFGGPKIDFISAGMAVRF